ncbi:hypothetical protein [Amycolatopsis pittospori]|uniref:hypothetical protein n=1 Tax=Amycolatopsis pittospori TaxID=2749434 RepID=UPI0015F11B5C|nr:hypothetical protein [Amycolatopsis pittospori]
MSLTAVVLAAETGLPGGDRVLALVGSATAVTSAVLLWLYDRAPRWNRAPLAEDHSPTPVDSVTDHRRREEDALHGMHQRRENEFDYVLRSRRARNRGAAIAGAGAAAVLLTGLGLVVVGTVGAGFAISLMSTVPTVVATLFYARTREADAEARAIRDDINRIILLADMTPGPAKDALIADLIRGSIAHSGPAASSFEHETPSASRP